MSVVWSDAVDKQAAERETAGAREVINARADRAWYGEELTKTAAKVMRDMEGAYMLLASAVAQGSVQAVIEAFDAPAVRDHINGFGRLGWDCGEVFHHINQWQDHDRLIKAVGSGTLVWSEERGEWVER